MFSASAVQRIFVMICIVTTIASSTQKSCEADEPPLNAVPAEAKQQILQSDSWRKVIQDLDNWLDVQLIYNKEQVTELRNEFRTKVNEMTAPELDAFQKELQQKLSDTQRSRCG